MVSMVNSYVINSHTQMIGMSVKWFWLCLSYADAGVWCMALVANKIQNFNG